MRAWMLLSVLVVMVACPGPLAVDFSVRLGSPSADAFQGSSGLLRVTLERKNGFVGEVEIGLQNPPEGVTASTTTIKTGTEAQLSVNLASSVPVGALEIVVVGKSGLQSTAAFLTLNVQPGRLSSQELIAQAQASGRIDLGTSFVYRAYALFGDGRLPSEFVGSGSDEEDNSLWLEIEENKASLSPAVLESLRPYTVRPNDPASAWSAGTGALRATSEPLACDGASGGWATQTNGGNTVRVWVRCPGDPVGNGQATNDLVRVLSVADRVYGPMTALMGPPIPDQTGEGAIDFYIVPSGVIAPRPNPNPTFDVQANRGVAVPAPPYTFPKASGYLMLPTWRVREDDFFMTVIHEFFHVLQNAHNAFIRDFWFEEASAIWASFHFNRAVPIDPPKSRGLHNERFSGYQKSFESLLSTNNAHNYYSYIWPLFMEHKADASLIGEAWRRLEGARTPEQGTNALDSVFSFKEHFRDFALQNMNDEFMPGDPLPRNKRYVGLEKDPFPDKQLRPRNRKDLNLTPGADVVLELAQPLEPLSAGYFKVDATPDPRLKQVKFDLEGLRLTGLDVDALLKINGTWESKPRDLNGKNELKFCLDKDEEKLETIWFIISNYQKAANARLPVEFRAKGLATACGGWSGSFSGAAGVFSFDGRVTWEQVNDPFATRFKPSGGSITVRYNGPAQGCRFTPSSQQLTADDGELSLYTESGKTTFVVHLSKGWIPTWDCGNGTFQEPVGGGFNGTGQVSEDGNTIAGRDDTGNVTFNFTRQ